MADLRTTIGGLSMKNPVMTASGTFGYGIEFADFVNLEDIGGIIVKGTTTASLLSIHSAPILKDA